MCRKLKQERKAEKNESEDFWRCGNFIHFGRSVLRCCFYHILQQFAWVENIGSGDCFEYFPEMLCFARPNAPKCPKILVNKQFYCPDNLRERSFSWQISVSVAVSKQQTVAKKPEESSQILSNGRGVPLDRRQQDTNMTEDSRMTRQQGYENCKKGLHSRVPRWGRRIYI